MQIVATSEYLYLHSWPLILIRSNSRNSIIIKYNFENCIKQHQAKINSAQVVDVNILLENKYFLKLLKMQTHFVILYSFKIHFSSIIPELIRIIGQDSNTVYGSFGQNFRKGTRSTQAFEDIVFGSKKYFGRTPILILFFEQYFKVK